MSQNDHSSNPFSNYLPKGGLGGFKLGPGTLGNLAMVAVSVFLCAAVALWALGNNPVLAIAALVFIFAFAYWFLERSYKFAEKHPAAALMGGAEYFHYLRDQSSAKDRSIVLDASPIVGGASTTPQAIEQKEPGDHV
jgi:hypothetical protein